MTELEVLPVDDLGTPVPVLGTPDRIVSLVPNLTEALWWWGRGDAVVGRTEWCVSPPDGLPRAQVVRGTKNPDVAAVVALAPDVVVANVDENRELDVRRLRDAGVAVHVTAAVDGASAAASLARLGRLVGASAPALATADAVRTALRRARQPAGSARPRVAVPVWRDPWLTIGTGTVVGELLRAVGFDLLPGAPRYPAVADDLDGFVAAVRDADVLLLPDEPWAFTAADRAQLLARLPGTAVRQVDGQDLTWWGPRTPGLLAELAALRRHLVRRVVRGRV